MATVTRFMDGDTVVVHQDGDPRGVQYQVRFRAIQAMEMHKWGAWGKRRKQAECNAREATYRTNQLIRRAHRRVRLTTQHPSSDHRGRLERWIAVRSGGGWQDLGETLIREGRALWMDNVQDVAWNRRYNEAEQLAIRDHRNLWNPTSCGVGPQQRLPIRVWVLSDPDGHESAGGEWVKIQNLSPAETLRLGHWWVRDAMLRRFTFPAGTTVAPGATVTLHVGSGTNSAGDFYWGLRTPIFENVDGRAGRNLGDGAYLFDPQGDLRSAMVYPCLVDCYDPLAGKVTLQAFPRAPEHLVVRNVSGETLSLYGYALHMRGYTYAFGQGVTLSPGESVTVSINGDRHQDSAGRLHWGLPGYKLADARGMVELMTFDNITLSCSAWGRDRCS
jgi:endonuclease YncB( thermonuclease family)